ncbi:MAG: ATP-binding protein [Candidatus Cloacimonetes bacterium]|nr:ATP-binding protein [Candidatus Cloacimonadota bacterium]
MLDNSSNRPEIESLTSAFQDFNQIVDRFQKTYEILQNKIDLLNKQVETKNIELEKKYVEEENIKNFLNNILENIYDGVIVIDNNGIITNFNRAAEVITGFHKNEILGKNYKSFNKAKNSESRSALYTLTTHKESYHRQKTILTSDKQEKNVEFSTTLLKDHEGNILGVVETFNDISEIKSLQDRITHVETLAALGEMSASVAHEIRNPLAGITGFAGLLDRQIPDDDPKKKLVKSIIQGTTKLNDIISNLLTLTRPQKINMSPVNIYSFLVDLVDYFKENFLCISGNTIVEKKNTQSNSSDSIVSEVKNIKFELEIDNQDTLVYLDIQLFQQIILNLLKNACEAIVAKGKITIKTKSNMFDPIHSILEDDEKDELIRLFSFIEISISDTGSGIPEDVIQKVFNPFFTTKNEGNGLGLAICKKIIQLHKGDIQIKSQLGKGTTFMINLPLYEQPS